MIFEALTGILIAGTVALIGGTVQRYVQLERDRRAERDLFEQQESLRSALEEAELASAGQITAELEQARDRIKKLRSDLTQTSARLAELQATVPFEQESRRAKWSSTVAFGAGLLVVAVVMAIGAQEWLGSEEPQELSTGAGIARLGVVAAAFYLSGQLFRRSTILQVRAQEFERAAIAMRSAKELAKDLKEEDARDGFIRAVYERHLKGTTDEVSGKASANEMQDVVSLLESLNKFRSPN